MSKISKREERSITEWLNEMLFEGEFYDYRYPVKGMGIWMPYGFELRENIINLMRKLLNKYGHKEVRFPILIPKDMLEKEATHIKGFMTEVYWVTKGGDDKLDVPLALRPTSETPMTSAFKDWVQSWRDLPIKVYQVGSIFRYETKATRPLIRVREVSMFKEAFTAHATPEDAWRQMREAIKIYSKFFDELGLPYLILYRPEWDRFAGAEETVTFDTILWDGRTLQIGSVHYLGQKFSRAFDAKFMREDGKYDYLYQLSYGISERVVASLLVIHSDDKGPILPPNIAPIQVVIVPIPYKGVEEKVMEFSKNIFKKLKRRRIRCVLDDRPDITPGAKYYYWERRGVPLRIEIGPKDVEERALTIARRDTGERIVVKIEEGPVEIRRLFSKIRENLKKRAWERFRQRIVDIESVDELKKAIENRKVSRAGWCKDSTCGHKIEDLGYKVLGIPYRSEKIKGSCIVCGRRAKTIMYIGRSY